nr:GNAT family N-acetyltransferase [Liquorilactobacillus satsumensis]
MVSNESKERIRLDFLPVSLAPQEYAIFKNPNLSRFTKHGPFTDLKTTQAFIARHNQSGNFFGIYLQNGELIGNCQLVVNQNAKTGEVAYGIAEEYWGNGIWNRGLAVASCLWKKDLCFKADHRCLCSNECGFSKGTAKKWFSLRESRKKCFAEVRCRLRSDLL